MVDDTYYISNHEAALAVVATAMKKSRLRIDTLVVNSIIGAFLFTAGGMLHLMIQAQCYGLIEGQYTGIVNMLQGAFYPIGLFYVVVMGMELFNSNVLFFTVGWLRGAVTIMDLLINWFTSFFVNLGATIFVVYVFLYLGGVITTENFIKGSVDIAEEKVAFSFIQTFLKSICCNFFVSLAIYLQISAKPIHVKLIMIFLPVFTFVSMGFNHVVADMFLIPCGIFNKCSFGWGTYFWKLCLPAALGNIVGGSFFGAMVPWYLHLVVIERDMKELNLPTYEERDEQPLLGMDSRVVRVPTSVSDEKQYSNINSSSSSDDEKLDSADLNPIQYNPLTTSISRLSRVTTRESRFSDKRKVRSPKGVFPVADMGEPLKRERTIACSTDSDVRPMRSRISDEYAQEIDNNSLDQNLDDDYEDEDTPENLRNPYNPARATISGRIGQVLKKVQTRAKSDVESIGSSGEVAESPPAPQRNNSSSTIKQHPLWNQFSFGGGGNNPREIHRRLSAAKISETASKLSNDISGIHHNSISQNFHISSIKKGKPSIKSQRKKQKKKLAEKAKKRSTTRLTSSQFEQQEEPPLHSSGSVSESELNNDRNDNEFDDDELESVDSNDIASRQSEP